ncbi:transcriptional regulator family: Fungal Specific TF and C2H2 zinc finger [Paecilomyces variotii]|nr:transcriptional regulator family: Fungal Specific TF and C2H2 zinc finger [Paecilomyces variotii]KAJ9242748.1 transcriptional regulator family: Fungal Specific TF and C2H2 zinc finger [Paecilomyces variotii]
MASSASVKRTGSQTTPSTPSKLQLIKSHVCDFPGCGKTFTRAEHLRRHALNHQQDDNSCERCGVHFTRPDLLGRHMMRHAKRDEEAGGPGLGVLETRKRTRRAPDGTIVTRPTKKQAKAAAAAAAAASQTRDNYMSSSSSTQSSCGASMTSESRRMDAESMTTPSSHCASSRGGEHKQNNDQPPHGAPVSPPRSTHDSGSSIRMESNLAGSCDTMNSPEPFLAPMVPGGPYEPYVEPLPGQFDAADGSWQTHSGGLDSINDDFFNLDTATSFNMPFAATLNYNWLFDVSSLDDAFSHADIPLTTDMANFAEPVPDMWSQPFLRADGQLLETAISPGNGDSFFDVNMSPNFGRNTAAFQESSLEHGRGDLRDQEGPVETDSSRSAPTYEAPVSESESKQIPDFSNLDWMGPVEQTGIGNSLPRLNEDARAGILSIVSQSHPTTPEGTRIDISSHLLTLSALQEYCDLFFTRFNTSYPLIHQATFDPNTADRIFLAAILSLGATYSSREAHQLAVRIHDTLRNHLFAHAAFSAQPDLWLLQTMLLIDCFGKLRAGQKQRDMAQLFHCVLIKLIRRSDCPIIKTAGATERPEDIETAWRNAMNAEQRKRLAMHCFMWDTQHAVLFSQSLCMSAFEIRSSLPCDTASWEAPSAEEWFKCSVREGTHPPFLSVLKAYITPSAMPRPRHLNAMARIFLLHGLMSVSSDLKRRDQTTLRSGTPDLAGAWKARMGRSYDLWKADFDADCMTMKLNQRADLRKFTGLKTASHVLYHAAHITLNVEVLDLQIYAGAPHILGRIVTASDFERSQRIVTRWVNEDPRSASKAARHASYILQDAVMNLNDWDDTEVFHYSWCLYLATLTCWAFHLPTSTSGERRLPSADGVDAKNEMAAMLIGMTTCNSLEELSALAGRFDTTGLTAIMAKQLATVRWAVVHDAMKVLLHLSESRRVAYA